MDGRTFLGLWAVCLAVPGAFGAASEERLVRQLFNESRYSPDVRPVVAPADVLPVNFKLLVIQVIAVNEKEEYMRTNVWVELSWVDYRLAWNKEDFDHIPSIRVPAESVWKPDIVLLNNKDGQYDVALYTKAIISNEGFVYWLPPSIFTSECSINVRHFPFDKQNCTLQFSSWTYNKREVDLVSLGFVYDDFKESGEWQIVDIPSRRVETEDSVFVIYDFMLARKPLFYIVNMIVPIILLTLLSILVFYLPVDCGEKVGLCINILLALVVFLLLIADIIPATSMDIPLIGRYLMFTMIFVTVETVTSIYVSNIHFRGASTHVMSPWIRYIFLKLLPRLMKVPAPGEEQEEEESTKESANGHLPGANGPNPWGADAIELRRRRDAADGRPPVPPRTDRPQLSPDLREAVGQATTVSDHFRDGDTDAAVSDEWKFVATMVDWICLRLFALALLAGSVVLFAEPWYEQSFRPG
ncbi:CHRNB2 [Branchiostoma lanceolatum]|uniref:CHRNB2 protein n=1 Tax=Branchiostoma lanceolatum TaxID=7740 RepID=A0A8K0EKV4_BRALA|nr:CHRNB2 [Branchiostoma lanceolatum]